MGEDSNIEVRAMPSARSGELRSEPVPVSAVPAPATIARRFTRVDRDAVGPVERALLKDADTSLAPFQTGDPGKHVQTLIPTPEWKEIAKHCGRRGVSLSLFLRIAARQHLTWLKAYRSPAEAAAHYVLENSRSMTRPEEGRTPATIAVTQADRDAAADRLNGGRSAINTYEAATIERLREGGLDAHPWVQAFARHRTEAQESLREALQWALDELNGRTRYDEDVADQQIENCYARAYAALASTDRELEA